MAGLPRLSLLTGIAGGFGMGIGCIMLLLQRENDNFANQAVFIKRAVEIMRAKPEVKQLLGDRIEIGRATFTDGWSKLRTLHVQVRVPIKGEHDNAYLFAYARKKDDKDKLRLYKLEATFEKIANKKLVILDRTDQEDGEEGEEEGQQQQMVAKPSEMRATEQIGGATQQEEKRAVKLTKEEYKQQMKSWAFK